MRKVCGIALLLLSLVLAVSAAPAPEVRPLGGLEGGVLLILRQNDSRIREELKLSESQVKKIEDLNVESRKAFDSYRKAYLASRSRNLSKEDVNKKRQELTDLSKIQRERIAKILTKKQLKRAEQIYLQRIGPLLAFRDKPVVAALKITDEQKEKMALIRSDFSQKLRGSGGGTGGRAALQKQAEMRKKRDEELFNVLTPAQKAKWKQLLGEPFKLVPNLFEEQKQAGQSSDRPALAK